MESLTINIPEESIVRKCGLGNTVPTLPTSTKQLREIITSVAFRRRFICRAVIACTLALRTTCTAGASFSNRSFSPNINNIACATNDRRHSNIQFPPIAAYAPSRFSSCDTKIQRVSRLPSLLSRSYGASMTLQSTREIQPKRSPAQIKTSRHTSSIASPRVPMNGNANYANRKEVGSMAAGTGIGSSITAWPGMPDFLEVQMDLETKRRGDLQQLMLDEFNTGCLPESDGGVATELAPVVTPKKRGRPPKVTGQTHIATNTTADDTAAPPKKRGRGRPKGSKGKKTLIMEAKRKEDRLKSNGKGDSPAEYQGKTSENTKALQTFYKANLLERHEEITLGTMVQTMIQFEEVHGKLTADLLRLPTFEEWANKCGYLKNEEYDMLSFYSEKELQSIRPVGHPSNEELNDEFTDEDRKNVKLSKKLEEKLPANEEGECLGSTKDFVEFIINARAAKKTMCESNMRLVISIARKYANVGVNLQDLVQEGAFGLMRAVEKYDPSKGFKFSTYASWWIQQSVFRAIAYHSRTIRLPVHIHNLLNKVRKTRNELLTKNGRAPSDADIARKMGMEPAKLTKLLKLTRKSISLELPKFKKISPKSDPGDTPTTLGDTIDIESGGEITPQQGVDHVLFHDDLQKMLTVS
mmetsp:Transcript_9600/g.21315  ORF Transcript_9600/g.21315 Transcript_9600/m.21315 type:complete len:640 (-) Transcript_9600:525-2444(-)